MRIKSDTESKHKFDTLKTNRKHIRLLFSNCLKCKTKQFNYKHGYMQFPILYRRVKTKKKI